MGYGGGLRGWLRAEDSGFGGQDFGVQGLGFWV